VVHGEEALILSSTGGAGKTEVSGQVRRRRGIIIERR
jgi:hypothetical protein